MNIDIQMNLRKDPILVKFIREYPVWYKILNRNPYLYKDFVKDMKVKYKLTTSDKVSKTINSINTFKTILDIMK